jgi:protein TonB
VTAAVDAVPPPPAPSKPALLGWPVWASIGAHAVGIVIASSFVALAPAARQPDLVPIEIVKVEPPPVPAPETPKPERREKPQPQERPQRLKKPTPPPVAVQREEAPSPQKPPEIEQPPQEQAPTVPSAPALMADAPRGDRTPTVAAPSNPGTPGRPFAPGSSSPDYAMPGPPGGGHAGSGKLFSTGDIAIPSAPKGAGGGRPDGPPAVAAAPPNDGNGLTAFARPLGGYQTKPRDPDSARREGIEGEALLRFQVLADGHVGTVTVARSAGHPDLDRAAVDAVKTWRFEPARRGKEAVTVWVTLPVRFQLQSGVGQ